MKRQQLLLLVIVPLLVFTGFRTVESIHHWLLLHTGAKDERALAPISRWTAAPAGGPADRDTQLVYASEETAELLTVIVNKEHPLPEGYEPADLTVPDIPFIFEGEHEKRHLREAAARAVERLFAAAEEDGIRLYGVSGYRSYRTQQSLYAFNVNRQGEEHASRYSATPGMSEHQTGLALDVTSESAEYQLEARFADTEEGQWLAAHAHEYGFVIRYPLGKEDITGYAYEPWHIRYIGPEEAAKARAYGLTLEEMADGAVPAAASSPASP